MIAKIFLLYLHLAVVYSILYLQVGKIAFKLLVVNCRDIDYSCCMINIVVNIIFLLFLRLQIQRDELDNPHKDETWRVFKDRFGVTLRFADPS